MVRIHPCLNCICQLKIRWILLKVMFRNLDDWKHALHGQDAVIHLAAETGTGQSMYEVERYVNVNVRGTAILIDLLANSEHHIQKVVLASSRSIYGEGKYFCSIHHEVYPLERAEHNLSSGDFNQSALYAIKKLS